MESIRVFVRVRGDEGCSDGSEEACIATRGRTLEISARAPPGVVPTSSSLARHAPQELNADVSVDLSTRSSSLAPAQVQSEARRGFSFTFDEVFPASASQEEVFEKVLHVVDESLNGFNVTIFAYGMTGSGKTHTISGTYDKPGIFIKLAKYLFGQLNSRNMGDNSVSMVFLSYIELYNNSLYDLLNSNSGVDGESTVRLHEHPTQGIIVTGSKSLRTPVHSAEEALELVAKGNKLRAVSSTQLNERSSRSHTIITFDVVTRAIDDDGIESERSSRINLVDLAGSERLKMSGADGKVLEETKHINKALSSLGDVLNSLSKHYLDNQDGHGRPAGHIPYRDSKLTMLLKSSLGGNTKTIMLATVRNSSAFYHQSLTTLRYAARARHIKNIPIRNVSHVSPSVHSSLDEGSAHDMMQTKLLEIMELRKQLQSRNNECSQLRQQLDIVSNKSFGSPKGSADESALQMKYEQMLRDLEARKNEEEAELKKRLKYVIMKKSELYESSLDTKDRKLQELSRIVEVTQIQKEKADLTNKELHRKIREGQHEIVELRARNEELLMKSNTLTAKFESLQSGNVDADALVKGKDKYKQLSKDLQALGRRQHETIASYEAKMNTLRHTIAALVGTTMLDISIDQDLTFDENIDSIVSLARSAIAPTRSPSKVSTYSADSASLSPPSRQDSSIRSELDRLRHVVEESSLHLSSLKSEHELEIFRIQNDYVESSASMKNEVSQLQKQLDESVQHQSDLKMSYERKIIEIQKKCMSDVQRYEEQIHLLKSDITHYKSQVFEMRNVVVDSGRLGENNTELRGTIQRLTTDLHASESLVRQLQADIHRLESTVDEEKRERQVEVSRLTQENNQKLSEMSDRMKISTNEIKRLKENIQSSDKALENLADQNRREISRLVEEHDITLANLKTAHQSALKSLLDNGEKATGAMNVVISEKEKQIQDLKGVVLALESNIQKSESDWNKSIEELRTKMAEFESERQNALELIGKLKFANDSLRSQLKEVNRDFTEYKANAESTISQLHDGSKNASKLFEEAKLKLQNSWEQMHAEVISQYEAQISQLKSGADAERESSDARYNQKLQEITVLEDRIHQLEEHISKVKADHLVEMDASISKGNDEVSKLRGINTRQASELLDLQSLVDKLQKVNCHMQADLKSQVEKVESQTVIIEDNNNRIKDLETEVQELCKFKDGHEIHVKALLSNTSLAESKNIELIEHYEAEVQKVRAECIALLKRGVGDLGDDGEEVDPGKLADKVLDYRNIIKLMKSQEMAMYQQLTRKTDEIARYRKQLSELKMAFSEDTNNKEQRINELEILYESTLAEVASLKEKSKYSQDKLASAMRESEHRLSQLQELLRGEQQQSRSLQAELQRCRQDKGDVIARLSEALKEKSSAHVSKESETTITTTSESMTLMSTVSSRL